MHASRRGFLAGAGVIAAGASLSAPALASVSPDIHWTMTSAFEASLDIICEGARTCAAAVSDMTDGHFVITPRPASTSTPAIDAVDAVAKGTVDCAYAALGDAWAGNPAYLFGSGAPFGMNARQHNAWLRIGGGNELIDKLLGERGLMAIPMGSTGAQMAGWFRKELRTASDLAGMNVRIGGFAGKVLEARGATVVSLSKDKVVEALANGSLDAFEWVTPYDDEKFAGATQKDGKAVPTVAPFYYFPGWWKGDTQLHLVVSNQKFAALPKAYQAALRSAAAVADDSVRAQYDAANPAAVKRLVMGGAELRLFPQEILEACFQTTNDLYAQLARKDSAFSEIARSYLAFSADEYLWWQAAEYSFENFMIRQRRVGRFALG